MMILDIYILYVYFQREKKLKQKVTMASEMEIDDSLYRCSALLYYVI